MLDLALQVNIAVCKCVVPAHFLKVIHPLQRHGDALQPISDLHGYRVHHKSARLLEVSELRDLLPVQPHFPAQPPGAERRLLPVVFHKADVMLTWIDADGFEGAQVDLLRVAWIRLEDDLKLVMLLEAVGVLAVAPVIRPDGRLYIGHFPGFRA